MSKRVKNRAAENLEKFIYQVRGQRVMLDADLAAVYGVTTKRLNEQVKRNWARFPEDFVFQLTRKELNLRSQIATSSSYGGRRYLPYVFTEHGAVMAANVLNSRQAVTMSVYVVRAFIKLREVLTGTKELAAKLSRLERQLLGRLDTHEKAILQLFNEIHKLLEPSPEPEKPKRRIGFHTDED